jgi:glycosyltransferase involved in cell wall biosynthesis
MTSGKVSVIIPSCNERHLQVTIDSVLAGARGDVEVLACLDAWWPNPS